MKKLLFLASTLALLAASCNANYQAEVNPPPPAASTNNADVKVDAAVDVINASVDSEESINMQSDEDVVNSDQSVIQEYEGAANANY